MAGARRARCHAMVHGCSTSMTQALSAAGQAGITANAWACAMHATHRQLCATHPCLTQLTPITMWNSWSLYEEWHRMPPSLREPAYRSLGHLMRTSMLRPWWKSAIGGSGASGRVSVTCGVHAGGVSCCHAMNTPVMYSHARPCHAHAMVCSHMPHHAMLPATHALLCTCAATLCLPAAAHAADLSPAAGLPPRPAPPAPRPAKQCTAQMAGAALGWPSA